MNKKEFIRKTIFALLVFSFTLIVNNTTHAEDTKKPYRIAITGEVGLSLEPLQRSEFKAVLGLNLHHLIIKNIMISTGAGLFIGENNVYSGYGLIGIGFFKNFVELKKGVPVGEEKKFRAFGVGASIESRLGTFKGDFVWSVQPTVYFRYNSGFHGFYIGVADTKSNRPSNKIDITQASEPAFFYSRY